VTRLNRKRVVLLTVIGLAVVVAMVWMYRSSPSRQFFSTKKAWEEKGANFKFGAFVSPVPPESENGALHPWMVAHTVDGGIVGLQNEIWGEELTSQISSYEATIPESGTRAVLPDLTDGQSVKSQNDRARALLEILDRRAAIIAVMEEVTGRPHWMVPYADRGRPMIDCGLEGEVASFPLSRLFELRAQARLELSDSRGAMDDLRRMLMIARWFDEGYALIDSLKRSTLFSRAMAVFYEGIVTKKWSDEELREFSRISSDPGAEWIDRELHSMKAEIAQNVEFFIDAQMFSNAPTAGASPWENFMQLVDPGGPNLSDMAKGQRLFLEIALPALADFEASPSLPNVLGLARSMESEYERLCADQLEGSSDMMEVLMSAELAGSSMPKFLTRKLQLLTEGRMIRLYAGVELYRSEHGKLPDSLDQLGAEWRQQDTLDPVTGESFLWKQFADGRAVIYSPGADLDDDGGAAWDTDARQGDWRVLVY